MTHGLLIVKRTFPVILIGTLVGCFDARAPIGPPSDPNISAHASQRANPPVNYDDQLVEIGERVPGGFGGLYFDDAGNLNVLLTNPTPSNSAGAASALLVGAARNPQGRLLTSADVKVHPARFAYRDLVQWYRGFLAIASNVELSTGDIDERGNRIRLGVRDESSKAAAYSMIDRLGVPRSAIEIDVVGTIVPSTTLRDTFRPVPAGVQQNFSAAANDICTLSFNVQHHLYGQAVATASHCTQVQGATTGHQLAQPLWGATIALEVLDPPYTTVGCQAASVCRNSDAALFAYVNPSDAEQGYLANTSGMTTSPLSPIITIDSQLPRLLTYAWEPFCIIGYPCGEFQGMSVQKIGRTTGKTSGTVQNTCVDVYYTHLGVRRGFRCSVATNYIAEGGDSGAPVYIPNGWFGEPDAVRVVGIHFAQQTSGPLRYYSRLARVGEELGANPSLSCKGFKLSAPLSFFWC